MESSFNYHGQKLIKLLKPKANTQEVIDFQCVMADLTFETICDIAFGVSPGSVSIDYLELQKTNKLLDGGRFN